MDIGELKALLAIGVFFRTGRVRRDGLTWRNAASGSRQCAARARHKAVADLVRQRAKLRRKDEKRQRDRGENARHLLGSVAQGPGLSIPK